MQFEQLHEMSSIALNAVLFGSCFGFWETTADIEKLLSKGVFDACITLPLAILGLPTHWLTIELKH